jgi:hypothetical protein
MSDDDSHKKAQLTVIEPNKHESSGQTDLFPESLVREMLDVERKRIDSMDKKTETTRMWIEASDASDKRQCEFQMANC